MIDETKEDRIQKIVSDAYTQTNERIDIMNDRITHSDGHTTINKTPKVTGKGQIYFINKYLGKSAIIESEVA